MDDPRNDPEYEYDDYDEYQETGLTSVGLPASQLALIIGVNAVISLVISIAVVLIANRQVAPGDVATPAAGPGESNVTEEAQAQSSSPEEGEAAAAEEVIPETTPLQSVTYVVEAGDTLGLISEKFSVPLADLMLANGLSNQDFIQVGQELVIPIGGLPTPTATFTAIPFPTETPLPFDPPTPLPTDAQIPQEPAATIGPSPTVSVTPSPTWSPTPIPTSTQPPLDEINVVITEITGVGDLSRETLVILNQGAGTSLKDWRLEGSSLAVFTFPDIFLFSGGSIRIHTAAGDNSPSDLYLNQGESAWTPGTIIILSDANSTEISRFTVPASTPVP
jgi:LysM repeat protein